MANRNMDLRMAKQNKADEFYTQMVDIELELKHYKDYFRGKTILCNCDDPFESNFFKYFAINFNYLGLKKLITTCYDSSPILGEQLDLFNIWQVKNYESKAYKIEINQVDDYNNDGAVDLVDVEYLLKNDKNTFSVLKGNGDFRSAECIECLKEADIVVTNPPFSFFRDYVVLLHKYNKKYIIIGNINAVQTKDIFPLFQKNELWLGVSIHSGDREFRVPDSYPLNASGTRIDENGYKYIRVKGVRWFTNLDIKERHEFLQLYKNYNENLFPHYFNYDAIDVNKTSDIPCDYFGKMGVPITFLDKYNPDQFEIIGIGSDVEKTMIHTTDGDWIHYIDKETQKIVYTFPYTVTERKIGNGLRISKDGKPTTSPYGRIIIRRKNKIWK